MLEKKEIEQLITIHKVFMGVRTEGFNSYQQVDAMRALEEFIQIQQRKLQQGETKEEA